LSERGKGRKEGRRKKKGRRKENRMETSWNYWLPTVTCH
jgi:hypothetical protein